MKTSRQFRESTPSLIAREILNSLGLSYAAETDIETICYSRGVTVIDGDLASGEAWLVRGSKKKKGLIRVNKNIKERGRRRFAIAHELGHWELHKDDSQLDLFRDDSLLKGYKASGTENEANLFAGELLMPRTAFAPMCDVAQPSWGVIGKLSEHFETTLTATAVRFVDLASEYCLFVVSENKRVKWFRANADCGLWIQPGSHLHENSFAYDCFTGSPPNEIMQEVLASAWFPDSEPNRIIWEGSFAISDYGIALTLLWIPYSA